MFRAKCSLLRVGHYRTPYRLLGHDRAYLLHCTLADLAVMRLVFAAAVAARAWPEADLARLAQAIADALQPLAADVRAEQAKALTRVTEVCCVMCCAVPYV